MAVVARNASSPSVLFAYLERMKRRNFLKITLPLVIAGKALFVAFISTSCVAFVGLDPAETLGRMIQHKSQELERQPAESLEFYFTPSQSRLRRAPNFSDDVTLTIHASGGDFSHSVIQINEWFRTTYHNRYVRVDKPMEATQKLGHPFTIVLKKVNGETKWQKVE